MLQLANADLQITNNSLAITIRRGKIVPRTGPYTLWLPLQQYPGVVLLHHSRVNRRPYLASESNAESNGRAAVRFLMVLMKTTKNTPGGGRTRDLSRVRRMS